VIQGRLRDLNYYNGAVDGNWGDETQQAIERFQQGRGRTRIPRPRRAQLRAQASAAITAAPAWLRTARLGRDLRFVHAGFHTAMLEAPPPPAPAGRVEGVLSRASFGEPIGRTLANGYSERSLRWVDRIPAGLTVYCGHDRRSTDGRPYIRTNRDGGTAIFLDTGAGKGGDLSWIDLPAD
jgi:protein phosphatase